MLHLMMMTHFHNALDFLKKKGRDEYCRDNHIGRIFGQGEKTSTTKELYEDCYGGCYDKDYPEK